jgi:hypothetical protein
LEAHQLMSLAFEASSPATLSPSALRAIDSDIITFTHFLLIALATMVKRKSSASTRKSAKVAKTAGTVAPSTFNDLPSEIWHMISSHLAPSDKAALTLTCQSSLACFGADVVKTLNRPSQRMERLKLLYRLHGKFPRHYLCADCCVYHLTRSQRTSEKYEAADLVLSAFRNDEHTLRWSDMSKIADDLREGKCTPPEAAERLGFNCKVAMVNGRLFVNFRHPVALTIRILQKGAFGDFKACKHSPRYTSLMEEVKKGIAAAPRPWDTLQSYTYESPIFRCPYCPMEFMIDSTTFTKEANIAIAGSRFAMYLNITVDLGRLHSPHDRDWAALTRSRYAGVVETVPYDIGSNDSLTKQFYTSQRWLTSSEGPVLPLLD